MINIIDDISTFLFPKTIIYTVAEPNETIISRMKEFFERDNGFMSSNDVNGLFTGPTAFKINVMYQMYTRGAKYSSTLIGEIAKKEPNGTLIQVKMKPSLVVYIFFFISIIVGIIYLINFFSNPHITQNLFFSLAILTIGFLIPIWIYKVSNAVLLDRFLEIIKKH